MEHITLFPGSALSMGCAHSKDHPKNLDLVKLKKKYETEPIRSAKLLHVWVIGADKEKSMELGKLISEEGGFLYVTQDSLLQTEVSKGTERGTIIQQILQDNGAVCPGIVLDLAVEKVLKNLQGTKGIIFHGIPRDKEQAWHLQHSIGPVDLVIYLEQSEQIIKSALSTDDDNPLTIKHKVENFQKLISQLSKHKSIIKVDGEMTTRCLTEMCLQKIKYCITQKNNSALKQHNVD